MGPQMRATILLVEDDPGVARLERLRLERAGYAVATAATAEEGLRTVAEGGIELIVLDQQLSPGTSGLEFFRQVKAAGYNLPAILVTGMQDEALLVEALRAGVRDFVPKTQHFLNHLEPIVTRVLDQVRTERELAESRIVARENEERRRELEREIAQRKRVEQALKDADERKDQFLAMLAHELRNPLAPISNAVQIMKVDGLSGSHFQWSLKVIEDQVKQMTRMVDDLLDVSRITRGKAVLQKEPIDLEVVVDLAVEASRPLIKDCKHQLTVSFPPDPILLEVDPARMAQVLSNLLNNAAKYTDEGGEISLTAESTASGREVLIHVRDNGIGIPPELMPHVFDMFTQADQTLSRSRGGLGIGLTLVRSLVEMHNGRVSVRSDGPDQGSEFTVRLPVAARPEAAPDDGDDRADDEPGIQLPRRRILVVDDNRSHATSLGVLLRTMGQDVDEAYDGATALELAQRHHPDVILLDIGLPVMDGYEVARRCRELKDLDRTMLVAMTGYGKEEDRRRSQEAGFHVHLVKPVNLGDLRMLLNQPDLPAPRS
ncbi:MAG: response regulator [Isosphaeraceae bacterium]